MPSVKLFGMEDQSTGCMVGWYVHTHLLVCAGEREIFTKFAAQGSP